MKYKTNNKKVSTIFRTRQSISPLALRPSLLNLLSQFFHQIHRQHGKVIHKIQWVLDLMRDAGGELAERGEFFLRHQLLLHGLQILQRAVEPAIRVGVVQRDARLRRQIFSANRPVVETPAIRR